MEAFAVNTVSTYHPLLNEHYLVPGRKDEER